MNKQLKNGKIETDEWEKRKTHLHYEIINCLDSFRSMRMLL